jgi:hypothetical protein
MTVYLITRYRCFKCAKNISRQICILFLIPPHLYSLLFAIKENLPYKCQEKEEVWKSQFLHVLPVVWSTHTLFTNAAYRRVELMFRPSTSILIRLPAWRYSHTTWPLLASWVYSMSVPFTFAIFWKLESFRRWPFFFCFLPCPYLSFRSRQLSFSLNKMKDHIDITKPSIRGYKTPRFFITQEVFK